jgi:predicted GNAT superfamily acetyltransferase
VSSTSCPPVLITVWTILKKPTGAFHYCAHYFEEGGASRKESMKTPWMIKIIENMNEMHQAVELQRLIWQESETDIIPAHLMNSAVHSGGLLIGAFVDQELVGFVFGFPGFYSTPDGPRLKHYSSILGIRTEWQGQGIGFALKRAQWQMVRHQGIDRITWTFDPLLSRNAWLNITRLGAVCDTYLHDFYGKMNDVLNQGLPSDRFNVDWWVNSEMDIKGLPHPVEKTELNLGTHLPILLVEIPADFPDLKGSDISLALEWRLHSRSIFEDLFKAGYLATDFVRSTDYPPRSYYVLCHGESTL